MYESNFTKSWLHIFEANILDLTAKSAALNIIENFWGQLAKEVYTDGRQFDCVADLNDAVQKAWDGLKRSYLKRIYKSISNKLIDFIERKGHKTNY